REHGDEEEGRADRLRQSARDSIDDRTHPDLSGSGVRGRHDGELLSGGRRRPGDATDDDMGMRALHRRRLLVGRMDGMAALLRPERFWLLRIDVELADLSHALRANP